jgi:hypothetical protein
MKRVEIDLEEETYEAARKMAEERHRSFEEMLADLIALHVQDPSRNAIIGLFASEAALVDQVCEDAMVSRERDPLRR